MNGRQMIFPMVRETGRPDTVRIQLDPRQPYLAHHDVGQPLLGTVMSLEAMAESARLLFGRTPHRITEVTAGQDCLVPKAETLLCRVTPEGEVLRAVLTNGETLVFSCLLHLEEPPAPQGRWCPPEQGGTGKEIIYNCFFHGPAFQVAERAYLSDGTMIARGAPCLPPLSEESGRAAVLPVRVVELCLQASGLLDAALYRRMTVPLSIERVELYAVEDLSGLWVQARHRGEGAEIHAWNGAGEGVAAVYGYRTKPMPYESGEFDLLCSSLQP